MNNFWLGNKLKVYLHIGSFNFIDAKQTVFHQIYCWCETVNAEIVYLGYEIDKLLGNESSKLPCAVGFQFIGDHEVHIRSTDENKAENWIILEIRGTR